MISMGSVNRKVSRFFFFFVVVLSLVYIISAQTLDTDIKRDKRIKVNAGKIIRTEYVEGDVLVKFNPKVSHQIVEAIAASNLATIVKKFVALSKIDKSEYAHLRSKFRTTQQMIQTLKKLPDVEAVSPNFLLHVDSTIPNDQNFDYQWALHNTGQMGGPPGIDIDAPEAWDITTGSSSVIAAIIDTGIDYNHPDLIPNLWVNPGEIEDGVDNDGNGYIDDIHGINAIVHNGDPMDDHSHGTHCAGIIGAVGNNDLGVVGINWNVKLLGTKFLDAAGYGTDADALECINYLIDLKTTYGQNIVVANASFGGGEYDPVMESAINSMGTAGIVFCAAAGNDWMDNDMTPHYPSSYSCPNIIAVTAVDYMGWQNFNYGATSVDLGAPGIDILSTISSVYFPQEGDIFFDDMESGSGNWVNGGINNSWAITTDQEIFDEPLYPVPSPPNFWSDSPGTPYLPNTDSWLMNASDIDLSVYADQDLYIGFGSAMLLELGAPVDHGYVEISGDGGSTWHSLMDFAQYGYYWYIPWYFIIPDSYKTSNFRFRFHLVTDDSIEYDGWLIDDVGIGVADYYGYGYKSGTSMAAPHVAGAVALIAAHYPSESVNTRIGRILNSVTHLPSLEGTCATEGMLNLNQAVSLPGIPENPSPSDGATGVAVNATLDWDDCPGANNYHVHFGTATPPPNAGDDSNSSYDPGPLNSNTTYYWQVVAENLYGETEGPIWSFTTGGMTQYTLSISTTLGGNTDPDPGDYDYGSGTDVEVNAFPDSGYHFSHWTGNVPAGFENANPISIHIDSNKSITANFSVQTADSEVTNVPASAFTGIDSSAAYMRSENGEYVFIASGDSGYLTAPVILPDGAKIKNIRLNFMDNSDSGHIQIQLMRLNNFTGGASTVFSVTTDGLTSSPSVQWVVDSSAFPENSYRQVQNGQLTWNIYAYFSSTGPDLCLYSVQIEYLL
jgi:subtilisin family serine protease